MSTLLALSAVALLAGVFACQQSYIAALRATIRELEDDNSDLMASLVVTRAQARDPSGYRTRVRPVPPEIVP